MKKIFFLGGIFIIMLSCSKNNRNHLFKGKHIENINFSLKLNLSLEPVCINEIGLEALYVVDTFLLFRLNPAACGFYISIYNVSKLEHKGQFVPYGRGPNEYLFFKFNNQFYEDGKNKYILNADFNKRNVSKINLINPEETEVMLENYSPNNDPIYYINQDTFLFVRMNNSLNTYELYKGDLKGNVWETFSIFNSFYSTNIELLTGSYCLHSSRKKIVQAMSHLNQVNFIDLENQENNKAITTSSHFNDWRTHTHDEVLDLHTYYQDIAYSDNFIFCLFLDKPIRGFNSQELNTSQLHVFDWDGNGIALINFDKYISSFGISLKNKKIYGLNREFEMVYNADISEIWDYKNILL